MCVCVCVVCRVKKRMQTREIKGRKKKGMKKKQNRCLFCNKNSLKMKQTRSPNPIGVAFLIFHFILTRYDYLNDANDQLTTLVVFLLGECEKKDI